MKGRRSRSGSKDAKNKRRSRSSSAASKENFEIRKKEDSVQKKRHYRSNKDSSDSEPENSKRKRSRSKSPRRKDSPRGKQRSISRRSVSRKRSISRRYNLSLFLLIAYYEKYIRCEIFRINSETLSNNLNILLCLFIDVVPREVKEVLVVIVEEEVSPEGLVQDEEQGVATVDAAIAEGGEGATVDQKEVVQGGDLGV